MIGIYRITSPSGKSYIGQSVNIQSRWRYHKGVYGKQPALHNSFAKYGIDSHCFEVLIQCDESLLDNYEEYFIDYYNTLVPNGLNLNTGGSKGRPSEETKRRISESGRRLGRKMSDSNKAKILSALKGKPKSDEHKSKLSSYFKGRKLSEEHSKNISNGLKGKPRSESVKLKIKQALTGRKRSEETKIRVSIGLNRYHQNKKAASINL